MKLTRIVIKNIRSFGIEREVKLDNSFNIIVGPNGGGKSNLLELAIYSLFAVVKQFRFDNSTNSNNPNGLIIREIPFNDNYLKVIFSKHYDLLHEGQQLSIDLLISQSDIELLNKCKSIIEVLETKEDNFKNVEDAMNWISGFKSECNYLIDNFVANKTINIIFTPNEGSFSWNNSSDEYTRRFFDCFNKIEKFRLLVQFYKRSTEDFSIGLVESPLIYISPFRSLGMPTSVNININSIRESYTSGSSNNIANQVQNISQLSNIDYVSPAIQSFAEYYYQGRWVQLKDNALTENSNLIAINEYLEKFLKIKFSISRTESPAIYTVAFTKGNKPILGDSFSSGEKQLIYFIFALISKEVRNSIIIIDEPELHLHKKFQTYLLSLLTRLAEDTDNQIIMSSHSPVFIDQKTIKNVIRIQRDENNQSEPVYINPDELNTLKDLLHIVNSQNNEKVFFADKVILVEGITDRLIFERLISYYQKYFDNSEVIEVIEVSGKQNLVKYQQFLEAIKVNNYTIADFDYLKTIGNSQVKELFITDKSKIDKEIILGDSKDSDTLLDFLDEYINEDSPNIESIKSFVDYIKSRKIKLKEPLSEQEKALLIAFINELSDKKIFILNMYGLQHRVGAIEDYLPTGYKGKDLEKIIQLINYSNFETLFLKQNEIDITELIKYVLIILDRFEKLDEVVSLLRS